MARKKQYIETEVIEKAMHLFWKNGYETTSMHQLEKEMGINKFSIYASFGSKNGVFVESLKCYQNKLNVLLTKLETAYPSKEAIKQYFYDFIEFSSENGVGKGCLMTNTANEIREETDEQIKEILHTFTAKVRYLFAQIVAAFTGHDQETVNHKADYLIIAMFGLSSATRFFGPEQIDNYIDTVLKNL
ncbi:TetR/AcrR family transcriptional regulator [Flavobacterium sp. ASW18X]|nr:TetR/AcrR family transcriptional regulator [Flavobacterium sp. ASW18X]